MFATATDPTWNAIAFVIALLAGATLSVAGFGVGTILTPVLALVMDVKLAIAAAAIPHFIACAARFWTLRSFLRRSIMFHFGVLSVVGCAVGAFMHVSADDVLLKYIFGVLLIFSGVGGLTGLNARLHLGKPSAWIAGGLSGMFGGLVGNQGGIRAAALLPFDMPKEQFVATATALALIVDIVRFPIYVALQKERLFEIAPVIVSLTIGCMIGTALGDKAFRALTPTKFRHAVSILIIVLGATVLMAAGIKGGGAQTHKLYSSASTKHDSAL